MFLSRTKQDALQTEPDSHEDMWSEQVIYCSGITVAVFLKKLTINLHWTVRDEVLSFLHPLKPIILHLNPPLTLVTTPVCISVSNSSDPDATSLYGWTSALPMYMVKERDQWRVQTKMLMDLNPGNLN
jgi:hypothetical protein